jgi:hypothetical protein
MYSNRRFKVGTSLYIKQNKITIVYRRITNITDIYEIGHTYYRFSFVVDTSDASALRNKNSYEWKKVQGPPFK